MRVSITSIIRALLVITALTALSSVAFFGLGLRGIATPFLLATAIEVGLIVVAVTWRFLTQAHPDSS